jgi:tetratricopeptide (TPR) repeat protein
MIEREPVNVPAWGHCGLMLYELGRFDECLAYFQKIVDYEPLNAVAWDAIGFVKMERGDFAGAVTALSQALDLSPKRSDVAADLALCLFNVGQHTSAGEALERRVGKKMGTREHYLMGRIGEATGNDPSAHYELALKAYRPPEGPVREGVYATLNAIRGVILSQFGKGREAREALTEAGDRASLTDPDRMILSAVDLIFRIRGQFIREVKGLTSGIR